MPSARATTMVPVPTKSADSNANVLQASWDLDARVISTSVCPILVLRQAHRIVYN